MTWSVLLILSIVVVAWLTAAATAVRSVSRIWLRHWVEQQLSGAGTAAMYLERPHRMLLTATTAVSLTVFAAGVMIGASARHAPFAAAPGALVYAFVLLVGGQLLPRAIGRRWATSLIPILLPPLQLIAEALAPALRLVRRLTGERALYEARPVVSDDEALEELLREGELEGVGERTEIAIISGVVQFAEKRIRDVMTPRPEIFAVEESLPKPELARRVAQANYSRVPVYRGSLDQIVGMVHVFDLLKQANGSRPRVRPVAVTRPQVSCKELLFTMLRERKHLAVVRDDAGLTVGVVTLEDLLEELVGDIRDEHDEPVAPGAPAPGANAPAATPAVQRA
ncbi:MAG TPA: CNNM domain-containing protein [Gemmatimonadaceae bacterium]|nr:CNNM domain-containing protein [Gemmatimonadaceae bacterium]